jgi:hypothetical protein
MRINIKYIVMSISITKEKMRVTEKEWMNDRDKVIADNIVQNMT